MHFPTVLGAVVPVYNLGFASIVLICSLLPRLATRRLERMHAR